MISVKSTYNLGLSVPSEINTRPRWNRHTISTWSNGPTGSKTNRQHTNNWFQI